MPTTKKTSSLRFAQLNQLVDLVAPTLLSPSHVAVVLCCYRHARPNGSFTASTNQIAKSARLSRRQTQRVLDKLEELGVIVRETEHQGPIPRRYRITGKMAMACSAEANDPCDDSSPMEDGR